MSRGLEKPVTSTVKPPAVCCAATLVTTGACAGIVMTRVGAGAGVTSSPLAWKLRVNVILPATVPVAMAKFVAANTALVEPAGTVKFAVRPPVENWIAGSSMFPTDEANVSVIVPLSGSG